MLFPILKLFGIDVPARIASIRANIERRVEIAMDEARQAARTAAVVAALSALAVLAVLGAGAVGLVALYGWMADNYGHYYGLAAVGGLLVFFAVILLATAIIETKSWTGTSAPKTKTARTPPPVSGAADHIAAPAAATAAVETPAAPFAPPPHTPVSAADLVAPLSLILSRVMKFPTTGNPILDVVLFHLRDSAKGVADEAVDGVVRAVRHGERSKLVAILGTAMLVGWIMARQSHRPHQVQSKRTFPAE